MEEIKNENEFGLGALPFQTDIRDYKLDQLATAAQYPEEFELEMCAVKNQGSVGSCVAHALAETVEYYNKIQENIKDKVSVGFIYGNRRNTLYKGSGMYVRDALSNMCKTGDVFNSDFNYNKEVPTIIDLFESKYEELKDKAYPQRFSTYFRLTSDNDIKYALMNYGPVVFAMNWYEDIRVDKNGIISTSQKNSTGGHCMVIYGWDKNGWKIQNSWGTVWGNKGRAILPYNIKKTEAWGITDEVTGENPDIIKPVYDTTILRLIASIINFIANLFKLKK